MYGGGGANHFSVLYLVRHFLWCQTFWLSYTYLGRWRLVIKPKYVAKFICILPQYKGCIRVLCCLFISHKLILRLWITRWLQKKQYFAPSYTPLTSRHVQLIDKSNIRATRAATRQITDLWDATLYSLVRILRISEKTSASIFSSGESAGKPFVLRLTNSTRLAPLYLATCNFACISSS
jgi:hypothetical protein